MKLAIQKNTRQKLAEREIPASQRIPISHLVTPTIFETKNGALGIVVAVKGCPFELQGNRELNSLKAQIAKFMLLLGDKYSMYVYTHRRRHNVYPSGEFPAGFSRDFNDAYKATFANKPLYVNDQYVVLITKPVSSPLGSKFSFLTKLTHKLSKQAIRSYREKQMKGLKTLTLQALQYLSSFAPRLLGEIETENGIQSELLSFFSIAINGVKKDFYYPKSDVSSVLPLYRLFFGHDTMEWQGNTKKERKLAAILSIQKYGPDTNSTGLDKLLKADFEYLSVHSYAPIASRTALDTIERQEKHLFDTNDPSMTQILELDEAKDLVGSNLLSFGMHHNTLMILADSKDELDEYCAAAQETYDLTSIKLVRESLNMESAFWGQIPGNASFIRRGAMISSQNFSDYCSLHNYHHGYIDGNHLGSALMLVESTSRTPLYLNFHEKRSGSKNDFSPGTATITGPTGFGKTTLMLALDAQSQKYGGTRIFFDRGRGAEPYVRAMGGFYTQLKPGESTGFNPLSLPKTAENINFLTIWLGSLLLKNDGDQLTADEENHVVEVINRSYTLPFEDRQLSNIKSFFPTNFERLINLKAWIHSHNSDSPDGKYAYLFDNASDLEHQSDSLRLENQRMAGFDMFSLLRDAPQTVIFSVMVYLFHRVEALIDGKALMGIYLEEGWQLLNNSYWVKKIEAVINAGRKKNSFLVFTTQFPNTIARSALATVLIEGASTHIFLPNDKASRSDYVDCFKLTERQYELILGLTVQERKFLVMQRQEAALGTFNLAGLEDYIAILSGNDASASLLDEIRAEVGDDPALWLPRFQAQRLR